MKTQPFFLAGQWCGDGQHLELKAPFDGAGIAHVVRPTREHLEMATVAAVKAFETTRKLAGYERQEALAAVHRGISDRKEEFARTLALEAGKPIKTARAEVERALFTFQVAAEESTRIYGEMLPLDAQPVAAGRWAVVKRFPLGPVAAITPFNFPLNLVAHKLAPSMAAGCTMVLKPASQTPLSALLLADVVQRSGWPQGALSVLPLSNEDAAPLVEDDRFQLLSFTGSSAVGRDMKRRAGRKRIALELGGNAGCIVHSDADLDYAASRVATGGFSYAGQSCISVQRVYVHKSVFDKFVAAVVGIAKKLKVGNPLDDATDVGPMIRESDAQRAETWINEAVEGGAELQCGGKRHGSLLEPTVLTRTKPQMKVNCMEVFAPVVTIEPYDDVEQALKSVNDSTYGLQAGLFTNDAKLIFRAFDVLEVGGVIAGDVPTFRIDHMPYGGVKESGSGREGIRYAIEEMTERKLLVMAVR